jgi:hypothetical protein
VWHTIVSPRAAFDELAARPSIFPTVGLVVLQLLLGWLNMVLFAAAGYDWLGTRRELTDPTYVGFFGRLPVGTEHWVPIFAAIMPLLSLVGLVVVRGVAQLGSKLWRGQGTFEQLVNTLAYAGCISGWGRVSALRRASAKL